MARFFEGWVDEDSVTAEKTGTDLVIAVEKLHKKFMEDIADWLVSELQWNFPTPCFFDILA